jgi:NADH:ubiquinone reductase (H+-translocating)
MRKRVVVLGAGYGGIFAAANLCRGKTFDIILIDKNPYHLLLQQIPFVICGEKGRDDITICLEDLFRDERAEGFLNVLHAIVKDIDLLDKTIRLEQINCAGEVLDSLQYDYLIISLGAETHYFGINGAEKHCLAFRSLEDAIRIRQKVEHLPENSTVVVGGGGPSGVSLAAALSELNAARQKGLKIKLVDSALTILPGWDLRLSETSKKVLEAKGVQIMTGEKIMTVTSDFLETESGKKIESNCTIWTAGVKGYGINITPEVERTNTGRIIVDGYSRIPSFANAFAIGDISALEIINSNNIDKTAITKDTAPQLAQFAVRQARFVAENIERKERGEEMISRSTFSQRGHTILLGKESLGILSGLLVTGRMCDYAEDSIVDNFIVEINNKDKGISAKALKARENIESIEEFPLAFNFVTYATSKAFSDLLGGNDKYCQ